MSLLEYASDHNSLARMTPEEDDQLCREIRSFLIESVSKTGGHLASNLGCVELTVALNKVFDPMKDRIIFDVGHQAYVHKLLTGRADQFSTLRKFGGLSGFPKPDESDADAFISGHASNSVSAALGMARARTLSNGGYSVVAVMGDGALTGGLAYEGLNDAGQSGEAIIVVLNDNGMSIQPNVGGVSKFLARQRLKPSYFQFKRGYRSATKKMPGGKYIHRFFHQVKLWMKNALIGSNIFDQMGFTYLGPVDGHDVKRISYLLTEAKELNCPVLLHIITKKGRGYTYAEEAPDEFHGVSAFDISSGESSGEQRISFSDAFGKTMCAMAGEDHRICAVTAAMTSGTGLKEYADRFPKRFFDVGIAEGHAVVMASAMAKQGMLPVVAVYSTFLQRAYDMLLHDVGILSSHVVFAVDRAGIVGADGETHQGSFDVSYLRTVPGMQVFSPSSTAELRLTIHHAVYELEGPVAVRYPRGTDGKYRDVNLKNMVYTSGNDVTLVCYGIMFNDVLEAAEHLEREGISCEIIKLWQIAPLDLSIIEKSVSNTKTLVVVEDSVDSGCLGQEIAGALLDRGFNNLKMLRINFGNRYIPQGNITELRTMLNMNADQIAERVKGLVRSE